jgi:hypothetical protein
MQRAQAYAQDTAVRLCDLQFPGLSLPTYVLYRKDTLSNVLLANSSTNNPAMLLTRLGE